MRYLIDTNTASFAIRGQHGMDEALRRVPLEHLAVSVVCLAEAWTGCRKSSHPERWFELWRRLTRDWAVLPFGLAEAERYSLVRAELERRGTPIGHIDLQIAATALVHDLVVVTDNVREFRRVPGLHVENWAKR